MCVWGGPALPLGPHRPSHCFHSLGHSTFTGEIVFPPHALRDLTASAFFFFFFCADQFPCILGIGTASRGSKHQSIKRHPVKSQSPCPICFIHLPNQVTAVSSYHVFSRILHALSSQLRHTWLSPVFRRWRAIYPSTLLSPRNNPAWNPPHVGARQSPPLLFHHGILPAT